jgi:hypothetical protein
VFSLIVTAPESFPGKQPEVPREKEVLIEKPAPLGDDPGASKTSPQFPQTQDRSLGGDSAFQETVEVDQETAPRHKPEASPIDKEPPLLPPPKPGFAQQLDRRPYLEVFLLKGDRDQMLKMPFKQEVLHAQMDAVLARSEKPTWEILMSLTAKDQADVNYVVETAKKKDNAECVLAAIEASTSTADLRHILLFLAPEADVARRTREWLDAICPSKP